MSVSYENATDLAEALRRAEAAHGRYEQTLGHADPDWPGWYARYMVEERAQSAGSRGKEGTQGG